MHTNKARDVKWWLRWSLLVAPLACNAAAADVNAQGSRTAEGVDLAGTVRYLASDELEGRGVGTNGLNKAADYIAEQFTKLGLKPPPGQQTFFQPFKMTTVVKPGDGTALRFAGPEDKDAPPVLYDLGQDYTPLSFSAEATFDAPIVFVGYSITSKEHGYDDFAGIDVKGKVALALRYEPHDNHGKSRFTRGDDWSPSATLSRKADAAAAAGAAALILVNPPAYHEEEDPLVPFARMYRGDKAPIPVFQARRAVVAQWLKAAGVDGDLRALQKGIDDTGEPNSFALPDNAKASGAVEIRRIQHEVKNVVAVLPGKGNLAHEYVVIGAHYDHLGRGGPGSFNPSASEIHNGADDNASGTAAMLELAEHFAKKGSAGRSIVFAAFTAEEMGLIGSAHFVAHPPVPLSRVAYMINLDMVGRIRNDILYIGGHGTAGDFDRIIAKADEKNPLRFKSFGKGGFGPSDHMSFALKKIPVLFLHSGQHRDYHRPSDDFDKVNYEGIQQAVEFAADIVGELLEHPREQYVDASDAHSMFNGHGANDPASSVGSASGGLRVSLGVVPDYAPDDEVKGLRISGTTPNSPAAAAGLKDGDVITQIGDDRIGSIYDLTDVLQKRKPGDKVTITVLRDGKTVESETTLTERKGR